MILKATENRSTLEDMSAKLQTALRAEAGLANKVQQLEADKVSLEERVRQLVGEETARGGVNAELEESNKKVCRLRLAIEEHEAAAKQVIYT